ncbi:MAG: nitroreductase family protein [Candidatus Tectomicrobia bacterium]|uniref:Nitroreductase family protein n=1 Tax=Tectimicrobiota bacterium TaxID=2528274 RepID=A0A933GLM5_UNCTE|nr:nitroreductase family protein [Candidatus Tectomicrobia bacterium]
MTIETKSPVTIDKELCVLCGECVNICLGKVLESGETEIIVAKPLWCNECGHCVGVCPVDAIMVGKEEPLPLNRKDLIVNPEQLQYLIRSRRSTRHYLVKPVPKEAIEQIIDAGRYAPTGGNMQNVSVTVVTEAKTMTLIKDKAVESLERRVSQWESMAEKHIKDGTPIPDEHKVRVEGRDRYRNLLNLYQHQKRDVILHNAPVFIVLHGEPSGVTAKDNADLMAMNMMLMAESMGLGTCLIGIVTAATVEDGALRKLMGVPEGHQVFTDFVLGYPSAKYSKAPGRNPMKVTWI